MTAVVGGAAELASVESHEKMNYKYELWEKVHESA